MKFNIKKFKIFITNNYEIIILSLMIVILLWLILTRNPIIGDNKSLKWISTPYTGGNYGTSNPGERLDDIVNEFGKPDLIDKSPGGVAIWKKQTLKNRGHCWERIEIHDEQVPHKDPAPHTDFLYTWYKLDVPINKINDVRALSKSVTYDPLRKLVRARCHFMHANVATLVLAKRIAKNEMTLEEARKSYGPFIFSGVKEHKMYNPKAYENMLNELCKENA